MNARLCAWMLMPLLLIAVHGAGAGELAVTSAWARATPPGARMGVVYFQINNASAKPDRLLKLKTSVAAGVEMHRSSVEDGIARMREVTVLHIAPREKIEFAPGGLHAMLVGLGKPLVIGQVFELELVFEVAGTRRVAVTVRS